MTALFTHVGCIPSIGLYYICFLMFLVFFYLELSALHYGSSVVFYVLHYDVSTVLAQLSDTGTYAQSSCIRTERNPDVSRGPPVLRLPCFTRGCLGSKQSVVMVSEQSCFQDKANSLQPCLLRIVPSGEIKQHAQGVTFKCLQFFCWKLLIII